MTSSVASIAEVQKRVREMLPNLSPSQANVLGLLSYAMLFFNSCGMTRITNGLSRIEQVPAGRLRQRLREWYYDAADKRGKQRRAVDVPTCFGGLLATILRHWQGPKQLALALDTSTLGKRFTVLNVSVLYRGCALPVAWVIIPAGQKGSWRSSWEGMLASLAGVVPADWKVIVTSDQGLYSPWLFRAIEHLGWHPMLRVPLTMGFRVQGQEAFEAIGKRVRRRGRGWKGKGDWSETGTRLSGTLLIRWEQGYEQALAVVSDLPPQEVEVAWYTMRFWIEDEYKDHKRGGFGWHLTKMSDPKRAERLWLAMAVAMLIAVLIGGLQEAQQQQAAQSKSRSPKQRRRVGRPAKPLCKPRGREQSVLVVGQQCIQAAIARAEPLPPGYVVAESWPSQTSRPRQGSSAQGSKCKKREEYRRYRENRQARKTQAHQERKRQQEAEGQQPPPQASQPAAAVQPSVMAACQLPAARPHGPQLPLHLPEGLPPPPVGLPERPEKPSQGDEPCRQPPCLSREELQRQRAVRLLQERHRAAQARLRSTPAHGSPSKIVPASQSLRQPEEPP